MVGHAVYIVFYSAMELLKIKETQVNNKTRVYLV